MLREPLPRPDPSIRPAYQQLIAEIDLAVDTLSAKLGAGSLRCGPGCSSCCTAFSVLPLEAALLTTALPVLPVKSPGDSYLCRLLVDHLCTAYPYRPVICRTQGLPIAYVEKALGQIEVSACPLNFADDYRFVQEDLLFLDRFNSRLAELNLSYCRTAGLNPQVRIPIALLGTPT